MKNNTFESNAVHFYFDLDFMYFTSKENVVEVY